MDDKTIFLPQHAVVFFAFTWMLNSATLRNTFSVFLSVNSKRANYLNCSLHIHWQAQRVGRVDVFVQSTDKNFMVPVGGAVVAAFDTSLTEKIGKLYPGQVLEIINVAVVKIVWYCIVQFAVKIVLVSSRSKVNWQCIIITFWWHPQQISCVLRCVGFLLNVIQCRNFTEINCYISFADSDCSKPQPSAHPFPGCICV